MNTQSPLLYIPRGNRPKPRFSSNNPLLRNPFPDISRKLCFPGTSIIHKMGPEYVGTTDYPFPIWNAGLDARVRTGTLGSGSLSNSPFASGQLLMALLIPKPGRCRPHREVMRILENDSIPPGEADIEALRREQALSGLKILDLGCGEIPAFARAARKLGAEAYTVDLIPASGFRSSPEYLSATELELEGKMHIQCDLNSQDVLRLIGERSLGFFDFVTEALLDIPMEVAGKIGEFSSSLGRKLSGALLKRGGFYFFSRGEESECIKKW